LKVTGRLVLVILITHIGLEPVYFIHTEEIVMQTVDVTMPLSKRIALVAHDHKKPELIAWALEHHTQLTEHQLFATGTTGTLLKKTGVSDRVPA
jgi:methylglyoxal synthase